jgi:SIR2-like domain
MDLDRAINKLKDGYCLWVGAGVTKQLWQSAPQWDELTKNLEDLAQLPARPAGEYADRLQRCADKLGPSVFRKHLRKIYYTDLYEALLQRTAQWLKAGDAPPTELRKIAALGQLANPIVSFNVEAFSSTLLARPGGPVRTIPFIKPQTPRSEFRELTKAFQRIVYHPHGLSTVDCIMTEEEYKTLNGTLAFRLAAHAAFGNHLAIVGMSLQDKYLRDQITEFRSQIESIIWFNSSFGGLEVWANCTRVEMVQVQWSEFWAHWNAADVLEEGLMNAWCRVVDEAADELSGGRVYQMAQSITDDFGSKQTFEDSARIGESGQPRLVDGQEPSNILVQLTKLLQARNILPPASMKRFRGVRS